MNNIPHMPSPHLKADVTISSAMRDVVIAMIPIFAVSVYFFKAYALFLISVCVVTAILSEYVFSQIGRAHV